MFLFFVSPPLWFSWIMWHGCYRIRMHMCWGPTFYEMYHPQETWTTRSLEHICNLYDRYTVIVAAVNCYLSLASSRKPPFALQPCQGRKDGSRTWRAVGILWVETWQRFDFEDLLRIFQVIFNINKIIHQPCLGWWDWISTEGNQEPKKSRFSQANHQILSSPGKSFGSGVPVNCADLAMGVCRIWFMMPSLQVAWQVACWLRFSVFVIFFLVEEACTVFVTISMETVRGYWDSWTSQVGFACDWKVKLQQDLQSIQVWHLQT